MAEMPVLPLIERAAGSFAVERTRAAMGERAGSWQCARAVRNALGPL